MQNETIKIEEVWVEKSVKVVRVGGGGKCAKSGIVNNSNTQEKHL